MSNLYKTEQYRGVDINIYYDEYCESPREFSEHMTTIWSNRRDYKADGKSIDDLLSELDLEQFPGSFMNLCKIADKKGYFAVPVYALIHSGISLSLSPFSDKWDSGAFGVVTIPKSEIYEEYGCKRIHKKLKEKLINWIASEMQEYEDFCSGRCFYYEFQMGEDEDRLDGFYGTNFEDNGLLDEARQVIDYIFESRERKAVEFWSEINKDVAA